jgi:hypothetical protein
VDIIEFRRRTYAFLHEHGVEIEGADADMRAALEHLHGLALLRKHLAHGRVTYCACVVRCRHGIAAETGEVLPPPRAPRAIIDNQREGWRALRAVVSGGGWIRVGDYSVPDSRDDDPSHGLDRIWFKDEPTDPYAVWILPTTAVYAWLELSSGRLEGALPLPLLNTLHLLCRSGDVTERRGQWASRAGWAKRSVARRRSALGVKRPQTVQAERPLERIWDSAAGGWVMRND